MRCAHDVAPPPTLDSSACDPACAERERGCGSRASRAMTDLDDLDHAQSVGTFEHREKSE